MEEKGIFTSCLKITLVVLVKSFNRNSVLVNRPMTKLKQFWVQKRHKNLKIGLVLNFGRRIFRLEKIGLLSMVYCMKSSCPLVAKESIFVTLVKRHERVGHSGWHKTWEQVKKICWNKV